MYKSSRFLLISFFFAFFNIYFLTPYLSLNSLGSTNNFGLDLFIASLIFATPSIAQATTLYLFNWLAEKKHWEKKLILIGYTAGLVQYVALFLVRIYNSAPIVILSITFISNLFVVAYIPAIKAYFSNLSPNKKGSILGKLNIIQTLAFGSGIFFGGIGYDFLNLQIMITISFLFSIVALILLILVPDMKIPIEYITQNKEIVQFTKNNLNKDVSLINSIFTFKSALMYQLFLAIFAAMFFGLFSAYLQELGALSWFYGTTNALAAFLGIIAFKLFGKILDKYGPDILFAYGWITYIIVYIGLLTRNITIIFIVWTLPAFTFQIATEYLATQHPNKKRVIRNMALATFTQTSGIAIGIISGGIIAIFGLFRVVLLVSLFGNLIMGAIYISLLIIKHYKV
ncbi:MAG: MFS transporter [Promethearchaeota archaeon]